MAKANFVSLRVYRLSEELADEIWNMVGDWELLAKDTVGKQLIRAADSIGANIAEGAGRSTYADNRRCVYIARGSLHETTHWLRRAFAWRLLTPEQSTRLKLLMDNLAPQLNSFLKSLSPP